MHRASELDLTLCHILLPLVRKWKQGSRPVAAVFNVGAKLDVWPGLLWPASGMHLLSRLIQAHPSRRSGCTPGALGSLRVCILAQLPAVPGQLPRCSQATWGTLPSVGNPHPRGSGTFYRALPCCWLSHPPPTDFSYVKLFRCWYWSRGGDPILNTVWFPLKKRVWKITHLLLQHASTS